VERALAGDRRLDGGAERTGAPACWRPDTATGVRRSGLIAVLVALLIVGCGGGADDEEGARPARPEPLLGVTIGELENRP
jgi:hypothetical protein